MHIEYWKEVGATSKLNSEEERKMLNIGNWNLRGLMILTLIFMGLLYFQITDASAQTNQAQAAVSHGYVYWYEWDIIPDEPVLMKEEWKWFVGNLIDTGEDMIDIKFTAETELPIIWEYWPPTFESPPIYVWDYGVDVPEDTKCIDTVNYFV